MRLAFLSVNSLTCVLEGEIETYVRGLNLSLKANRTATGAEVAQ